MNRFSAFAGLPLLMITSAMVACSGGSGASSSPPSSSSSTTSLSIGECADETAPTTTSSSDDKATADGSCRARGLALASFDDSSGTASYSCCKTAPTPVEIDGGSGGADAGTGTACEVSSLGSPTSSADPGTWKDDATKTCEIDGLTLSGFSVADPTGDGDFRFARITCCGIAPPPTTCGCPDEPVATPGITTGSNVGPTPLPLLDGGVTLPVCECPSPPPPVPVCEGTSFSNAKGFCTSLADARSSAAAACTSEGKILEDFTTTQGSCAAGTIQSGSYSCCGTEVVGPPVIVDGGGPVAPTPIAN